jgi:predicted nucleic acid-binding protein
VSFLLDTNLLSEVRKGERADPGVQSWFRGVAADDLFLSVLVLGEIRRGVELKRVRDLVRLTPCSRGSRASS